MRTFLITLFSLMTLSGFAQNSTTLKVPAQALTQLEDLKELTKAQAMVGKKASKVHAEVNPELNRWLVVGADDFVRVTSGTPTKEAYLQCIDRGLARLKPLTRDDEERQQVAEFYQELMEIVGLESSEGRLASFAGTTQTKTGERLSQREGNR